MTDFEDNPPQRPTPRSDLGADQATSSKEEPEALDIKPRSNGHIPPHRDSIYHSADNYWRIPRPRGIWAHILTASITTLIGLAVAGYNGNIIVPPWRSTASESQRRDEDQVAAIARLGTEQLRQGAAIMDLGGRIDSVGIKIERLTGFVQGEAAAAAKRGADVARSLGAIAENHQETSPPEIPAYLPPKKPRQKRAAPASAQGWAATQRPAS